MSEPDKDTGVILALLQRMESQRLPRVLAMKEKVDQGESLADYDITFLQEVFADFTRIKPMIDRHPEYHELAGQMMNLYHDITTKALENEKAPK